VEGTEQRQKSTNTALPGNESFRVAETAQIATDTEQQEKQERVTLRGRVGAAVRQRTTSKGTFIAKFPFATHAVEEDATTWYEVVAFQERARKLVALQLKRGEAVQVIGYLHETSSPAKDGKPESLKREIYAAAVKRL
jgi:single-stranded DNA-binding protein